MMHITIIESKYSLVAYVLIKHHTEDGLYLSNIDDVPSNYTVKICKCVPLKHFALCCTTRTPRIDI